MNKASLADNSGRWFDIDSAREWPESVMLASDGTPVSRASGNSWEHETLYLTSHGSFVMHFFDEHNPSLSQFVECDPKKAVKWLLSNGYNDDVAKLDLANEEKMYEM
jgi:hypothetical protein